MEGTSRNQTAAHFALLSLIFAVMVRTAWLCDDSLATLRTAVHLVNGYGPTAVVGAHVRNFVHPLWFLLISAGTLVSGNAFAATYVLSMSLSLIVMWLLISRVATSFWAGMLAGSSLVLSKAYVDYFASGLENPLSHVLLIGGVVLGFQSLRGKQGRRLATVSLTLLTSIYLSRPELILLVFPFCMVVLLRSFRSIRGCALMLSIAVAPTFLWSLLSYFYYGALLPSGAFAKMRGTLAENLRQGIWYLADSFSVDPITLIMISIGILLALRGSLPLKALGLGVVLYLSYVLSIGGDSMSGRLLTIPLLVSAAILARSELPTLGLASIAIVVAVPGAISFPSTILAGRTYSASGVPLHGIRDERGYAFPSRGLANASREAFRQPDEWTPDPKQRL
jgi:arabinofuranosyltransferase